VGGDGWVAGVVEKTPQGWALVDGVSLEDAFSISDELRRYAEGKAALVRLG